MKHRTKKEFRNMGELQFWREIIAETEEDLKTEKDRKRIKSLFEDLIIARKCNKAAEEIIFGRMKLIVWIVNIAVILSIICTGCNTVQGIGHDTVWIGKAGQQMLEHGHESMK